MRKIVRRQLPLDVYNRAITFLYGTAEQINAELVRDIGKDAPMLAPSNLGKWVQHEHGGYLADYICVVRGRSAESRVVALAHECLHCAIDTLRHAGIPLTDASEEAYTYYHQWLLVQCLLVMRGRIK